MAALLLLFPLTYLPRGLLLIAWAACLRGLWGIAVDPATLLSDARNALATAVPVWLGLAGLILVWPLIAGLWERFFNRSARPGARCRGEYAGYAAAAAMLLAVAAAGWLEMTGKLAGT